MRHIFYNVILLRVCVTNIIDEYYEYYKEGRPVGVIFYSEVVRHAAGDPIETIWIL